MKTAVFFLSPFCGGAERMTITIAKLLDRSEYDVRFVVIGTQVGEIKEFVPENYPLSLIRIRNIYDFTTLRIRHFLRDVQPQYVFCSLHYLNPRVIKASKCIKGCKVIVRFNCAVERVKGFSKWLTEKTYPKADTIIAQTEKMQSDIVTYFNLEKGNVITLHNLIDKENIAAKLKDADNPYADENRKVFVWVGRFDRVKGADLLIEAFAETCKKRDDICLYLIGKIVESNEFYQSVKKMVEEKRLDNKVVFAGFQDNPYKWMKNADCFVLSSRSEGSPNALFEALYLGIPSVATRCTPNIDDIIVDGVNGYKVEVGDSIAMAECMNKALLMRDVKTDYSHSSAEDFKRLFL